MGKLKWDQVYYHGTNESFRIWGKAISDRLSSMLVKTTDTGQIDWTTVNKPSQGVTAGYEVYRFDDALQATAPIFIRIDYGSSSASGGTTPMLSYTIADGTDGAGKMIGGAVSPLISSGFSAIPQQYLAFPSYMCVQPGYFGMALAGGLISGTSIGLWLVIERCRDDAGVILDEGALVTGSFFTSGHYLMRNVQPKDFLNQAGTCLVPGNRTTSRVGNEIQVYRHYTAPGPLVRNLIGICTHMKSEIPAGTEFATALMNGETHTYLALADWAPNVSSSNNNAHSAAIRFE